jgi:hypothetical protein
MDVCINSRMYQAAAGGGGGLAKVDIATLVSSTDGGGNITITGIDISGSNKYAVLFVTQDTAGDPGTPTATLNGTSMGSATEDNTTGQWQAMFGLLAPGDGTNLSATVSGLVAGFDTTVCVIIYSGVNQSTPIGTIDITSTTGATSLSSGTVACAANNWIIAHLALGNGSDSVTCVGAETPTVLGSLGSGFGAAHTEDRDGADDTIDFTFADSSQRASLMSFELKAA